MPSNPLNTVAQQLRRTVLAEDAAGVADGQLLEGFVNRRDQAALEVLVRRHSTMVWEVCRRILRHHDAEDAFQATFLILVRRAASILPREMVASWLYGVAHRTALNAREAARRRAREKQLTDVPDPQVPDHDRGLELQSLIDQELSRIPDRYRVVFILCDLECKTRKEAAGQLGLPEGTVASRLARARALLARRLARRGVVFPAGALATALSREAASAGLPASLTSTTIEAVTLVAAGRAAPGLIPAPVAALTRGVLTTMLLTKLKKVTALLLLVVLAMVGASAGLRNGPVAAEQAQDTAPVVQEKARRSDKEAKLPVPPPEDDKEGSIRPGDRLQIKVNNAPPDHPIKGVFRVEPRGTVPLGAPYGRVQVKGQTLEEAEETIRAQLAPWLMNPPQVSVTRYDPLPEDRYSALEQRVSQLEKEIGALRSTVEQLRKQKGQ
jgi:RNA polymerase sigma factor (sigma-70 family)